jgi:hypothetical protein
MTGMLSQVDLFEVYSSSFFQLSARYFCEYGSSSAIRDYYQKRARKAGGAVRRSFISVVL